MVQRTEYRGPRSGRRLLGHWGWTLLANITKVRVGRRMDTEATEEGQSRRRRDRMIVAGREGKSQRIRLGLGF